MDRLITMICDLFEAACTMLRAMVAVMPALTWHALRQRMAHLHGLTVHTSSPAFASRSARLLTLNALPQVIINKVIFRVYAFLVIPHLCLVLWQAVILLVFNACVSSHSQTCHARNEQAWRIIVHACMQHIRPGTADTNMMTRSAAVSCFS